MATLPAAPSVVEAMLDDYGQRARRELLRSLPMGEPGRWLYHLLPEYPLRAGKGLRPALCIATCRAFGGTIGSVLTSAAALELLHNAFLVHDDIQDGSRLRRGRPALHVLEGVPLAVNAGDALAFLAIRQLVEASLIEGPSGSMLLRQLGEAVTETLEGQAVELGWIRDNDLSVDFEAYLRMTLKKTSWYTIIQPCRTGATVAAAGIDVDRFIDFGYYLGAMFQIQDDLLNLVPGSGSGEDVASDVFEAKRTLMLIHLLGSATPDQGRFLRRFLGQRREDRTREDARQVLAMMIGHGSIAVARACLLGMAEAAIEAFETAFGEAPDTPDKRFIRGIVPYLLLARRGALYGEPRVP